MSSISRSVGTSRDQEKLVVLNVPPLSFQELLCIRTQHLAPESQMMEDKRKKRSPKVSLPQPPPPPINPRKPPALPASKSATFSLGLPQPPSPKNRGKYKRSVGQAGQPKEVFAAVIAPPKTTRCVRLFHFSHISTWKCCFNNYKMLFYLATKVDFHHGCHCCCLFLTQTSQGET